jgi:type I restriction enzyme, S subunit
MGSNKTFVGKIANFYNSKRKPVTKNAREGGEFPYYGAAGIQDYVADYLFDGKYILVGEDGTVINDDGKPVVQIASGKFWVNNHAHVIQPVEADDTDYLFYSLKAASVDEAVTGAVQPKLSMTNLKQLEIDWLEDGNLRRNAGSILSILDAKIRLNNELSQTLEAIAQTIFKSWFIDFDPVHAKMRGEKPEGMDDATAALFPDSFEESELGLIPSGWRTGLLGDFITPKKGKSITKSKTKMGVVPVVGGGLGPAYFHSEANVSRPVVTVSASGANAGFVRLYHEDIWASDCSYVNREIAPQVYFWYLFLSTRQGRIYEMQQGGAQPHIYPSDLMRLTICRPENDSLLQKFEQMVSSLFEQISQAEVQSKCLGAIRDALLPRLISGELQIPDEMLAS